MKLLQKVRHHVFETQCSTRWGRVLEVLRYVCPFTIFIYLCHVGYVMSTSLSMSVMQRHKIISTVLYALHTS